MSRILSRGFSHIKNCFLSFKKCTKIRQFFLFRHMSHFAVCFREAAKKIFFFSGPATKWEGGGGGGGGGGGRGGRRSQ